MELILGGLFAFGLLLVALWAWSLQGSLRRDREAALERARQELEQRKTEAREARRRRRGVPLVCLGCGHKFAGPVTDAGCPACHLSALVVTEAEAKEQTNGNKN